jgi:glucose-1-phosphatase
MIKNIIFDFGDIFINLDKEATLRELFKLGVEELPENFFEVACQYERGEISTQEFIGF